MPLRLENISIADRAVLSEVITQANFDDPYGQTVWPNSTIESRYAGTYARLPKSLLSPGNWFMECVESVSSPSSTNTDTTVAYAQWTLPLPLWERLRAANGGDIQAEVSDSIREAFEREHAESCTPDGEPRGMRTEVVEFCSPGMEAANERCFPRDGEEYIMLVQVKTLPSHQRRGAGQLLTEWGVDLANRGGLKICLESTAFGRRLYEKCGVESREEVMFDVSRFGRPREHGWSMMVKEPEKMRR